MADYLMHVYYLGNDGNPWREDKGGRFGRKPPGYRVNRYETTFRQNVQGPPRNPDEPNVTRSAVTLSPRGQARWEREKLDNARKKKENQVKNPEELIDPDRWIREDLESAKSIAGGVQDLSKNATSAIDMFNKPSRGPRYDLSSMSDAELRAVLNREQMERQYNDYFNPPTINKGAEFCKDAASVIGTVGGIASTALGIVIAVNQIRGKGGSK